MDIREAISNQNDVSLTLARQVILGNDANSVFSPLSLQLVLALLAAGCEGPTQDQLLSFLNSKSLDALNYLSSLSVTFVLADGSPSGGPLLSFANGVWIDQSLSFNPHFKNVVDNVYKAACSQVDFQRKPDEATDEVNAWSEKETNGLIKDILPRVAVNIRTRLIFANALYFKGAWEEKFDASKTREHEFHLPNGGRIKAPFMTSKEKQYVSAYDGFKVLRLPYKQGDDKRSFSMNIYLPDVKNGLGALVDKVCSEPGFLDHHLPYTKTELSALLIPKFKISFGFEASETLKHLGLVLPFDNGGLTGMVDSPLIGQKLFVSNIFHKSFIEVNELGTEAASVSAVVIEMQSLALHKLEFVADHPFLFLIREEVSGLVKFMGSVLNPLAT